MPRLPKDGPPGGAWQWSRTAQTQRALLDAAREVFAERGFAEASIADIVQRAGSSVGSLYHHFGGKSELFIALWQEHQLAHEEAASQAVADARKQGVTDPGQLFEAGMDHRIASRHVDFAAPLGHVVLISPSRRLKGSPAGLPGCRYTYLPLLKWTGALY